MAEAAAGKGNAVKAKGGKKLATNHAPAFKHLGNSPAAATVYPNCQIAAKGVG